MFSFAMTKTNGIMEDIERFEKLLEGGRKVRSFKEACGILSVHEGELDGKLRKETGFSGEEIVETYGFYSENRP